MLYLFQTPWRLYLTQRKQDEDTVRRDEERDEQRRYRATDIFEWPHLRYSKACFSRPGFGVSRQNRVSPRRRQVAVSSS
jgi:hypothetical protein